MCPVFPLAILFAPIKIPFVKVHTPQPLCPVLQSLLHPLGYQFKNNFLLVRVMYKELYIFNVWMSWVLRWVYICETIMPIYVINISPPDDSSCPEKSYVLGNKICQFLVFMDWWASGSPVSPSTHCMLSQPYPSLPSAPIAIFLSVALKYISSVSSL